METKNKLKELIEYNLINLFSKKINKARDYELYYSIAHSLRYYFSRNWLDKKERFKGKKTTYFLSFEYLPGKNLTKIAKNLGLYEDLRESLFELGISYEKIEDLEKEPALGNGSMATNTYESFGEYSNQGLNAQAYGLRYKGGLFNQQIVRGSQIEEGDYWLNEDNPWEFKKGFKFPVEFRDFMVYAKSFDSPSCGYMNDHVNTFRLWDVEFPDGVDFDAFSNGDLKGAYYIKNKASSIVEFLYPEDSTGFGKELRLYQEYFYASASSKDILRRFFKFHDMGEFDKIQDYMEILISDIHPVLSIIEFIRVLVSEYGIEFNRAFNKARKVFSYTNFGVVNESFETWHMGSIKEVCPIIIPTILKIDTEIRKFDNNLAIINNDRLNLFNLALYFSKDIFVLNKAHKKNLEEIISFKDYRDKISSIDMGVCHINWIKNNNDELSDFLFDLVGDYTKDIGRLKNLDNYLYDGDVLERLSKIKINHKIKTSELIKDKLDVSINPYSIYDMQLERIHEYKRQLLNGLEIAYLYFRLRENPNLSIPNRTYFFSGKAPKTYTLAKEVIKFINALAFMINRDLLIKDKIKIIFVPNINVKNLYDLARSCDIYKNLADPKKETGFGHSLYFMTNGAINVSTNEGALNIQLDHEGLDVDEYIYRFKGNDKYREMSLNDIYYADKVVKFTIDNLINAKDKIFPYDFNIIYRMLLQYNDGFNVIRDLESLEHTQGRVYNSYYNKEDWNRKVLRNISLTSKFSIGETVNKIRKK